jgi:hypothetical protein
MEEETRNDRTTLKLISIGASVLAAILYVPVALYLDQFLGNAHDGNALMVKALVAPGLGLITYVLFTRYHDRLSPLAFLALWFVIAVPYVTRSTCCGRAFFSPPSHREAV